MFTGREITAICIGVFAGSTINVLNKRYDPEITAFFAELRGEKAQTGNALPPVDKIEIEAPKP